MIIENIRLYLENELNNKEKIGFKEYLLYITIAVLFAVLASFDGVM